MAELLLEILGEEIPAHMQAQAAADLEKNTRKCLHASRLEFEGLRAYVTPRRLTLVVEGLPLEQPDTIEEKRGPRVNSPDDKIGSFVKSVGVRRDHLEERETGKGTFYFAVLHREGRATISVLSEYLPEVLTSIPWPKSMRWGKHSLRWVRPIHGILCVFDNQIVPFMFGHLSSGNITSGHRFLDPKPFMVKSFYDYQSYLDKAFVMLDPIIRQDRISTLAKAAAKSAGLTVKADSTLVEENAGLVEWPTVLMGKIDPSFMDVPEDVLMTVMNRQQKYLALTEENGSLAPRFLIVTNMVTEDGGQSIIDGNERVLRARLSDAKFFWDQDRTCTLESRVTELERIVFHAKLGSLAKKIDRLQVLAEVIATYVPNASPEMARKAAFLCKADLTTGMVSEFPELQGLMGKHYACHDGEDPQVSQAIAEHYTPQGPHDDCPNAPVSICVALTDKIDSLVGFFGINEKPTGSKDPFALRRAALGVIRLVLKNELRLPLREAFRTAANLYGHTDLAFTESLLLFFTDRLKAHLRKSGVRQDLIAAVFAAQSDDDLLRLLSKVRILGTFLAGDDGINLLIAYRRASNIVLIEEKRDGVSYSPIESQNGFSATEEIRLFDQLHTVEKLAKLALDEERFIDAMHAVASLRVAIDAFFDKVTVNCDDLELRKNRLRLLARIRATLDSVANFSLIAS